MGLRETIGRVLALLGLCGGRHLRLRGHLDRVSRYHPRGLGEMTAKGGIRRQEFPFLTQYGTPYALYDEQDDGYIHALKSEEYRFGGYVDLRVEVAGPVIDVGREVPLDERY